MEDDWAARCRLSLPEYQAWCWAGDGTYQVARLLVKWVIDDLATEAALRQRRQPRRDYSGWHGGEADPDDSVDGWTDDGHPEAA